MYTRTYKSILLGLCLGLIGFGMSIPLEVKAVEYQTGDGYIYNTDCPGGILEDTLSYLYFYNTTDLTGANASGCSSLYPLASTTRASHIALPANHVKFYTGLGFSGTVIDDIVLTAYEDLPTESEIDSTRIDSVTPYDGELVATSTSHTIGATGNVSDNDWNSGSELKIHIENSNKAYQQCADVICSQLQIGAISLDFSYDIVVPAPFTYSSTTQSLPIGKYWVTTSIRKGSFCLLGACLSSREIFATSTTFTVATTTRADKLKDAVIEHLDGLSGTGGTFPNCSIGDFNLFMCGVDLIDYAFVPTSDAISYSINRLREGVLVKMPFGYATRFVHIVSNEATSTLPTTDIPIIIADSNNNMLVSTSTLFQPEDMLTGAGEILNDLKDPIYNKSARDVFEPIVNAVVAMTILMTIIADLLGSHNHIQQKNDN